MRKAVRFIAAATLLAIIVSGSTTFAAQRESAMRRGGAFARLMVWINSRISPPIGVPQSDSRISPPIGVTPPPPPVP
jgi:hypothetical protein